MLEESGQVKTLMIFNYYFDSDNLKKHVFLLIGCVASLVVSVLASQARGDGFDPRHIHKNLEGLDRFPVKAFGKY